VSLVFGHGDQPTTGLYSVGTGLAHQRAADKRHQNSKGHGAVKMPLTRLTNQPVGGCDPYEKGDSVQNLGM